MEISTINQILSAVIFVAAYALIIWDRLDRTIVALSGATLMVLTRILTQQNAFFEIDYNTLCLLISMMVIVMITKRTGVFEYLAVLTVKAAKGDPVKVLVMLSIITGILSAFLDNVTTILLILPVTLSVTKDLRLNPIPYIIAEVFASNAGGSATLIGDPPNIMIGSSVGLTFMEFINNVAVIAVPILFISTYIFVLVYRKKLVTTEEAKLKVLQLNEKECIKDPKLLVRSLVVLGITILGFILHGALHYESSTIAMFGAVLLLLISGIKPERVFQEIEWKTIFFFAGLFIMVGGIKETGIIKMLASGVIEITGGDLTLTALSILWVSAIASAFIDNIPFCATMIPLVKDLGAMTGMDLYPVWWSLSLGACLGGNGTVIGASANVIASGVAEEHGYKITFIRFFKTAFPIMIITIIISTIYIYLRYLI